MSVLEGRRHGRKLRQLWIQLHQFAQPLLVGAIHTFQPPALRPAPRTVPAKALVSLDALAALMAEIDADRGASPLASAARVAALMWAGAGRI